MNRSQQERRKTPAGNRKGQKARITQDKQKMRAKKGHRNKKQKDKREKDKKERKD